MLGKVIQGHAELRRLEPNGIEREITPACPMISVWAMKVRDNHLSFGNCSKLIQKKINKPAIWAIKILILN